MANFTRDGVVATFWRTSSMMEVGPNFSAAEKDEKRKATFKFMLSNGTADKTYNKDSKTYFNMEYQELYSFIIRAEHLAKNFFTSDKEVEKITVFHKYNDENKVLSISPGKDGKSIIVALSKGDSYYRIVMDVIDFKYFLFTLKKILYFMTTNTLVGFTNNWI